MSQEGLKPHGLFNEFEFEPVGWWTDKLRRDLAEELSGHTKIGRGSIHIESEEDGFKLRMKKDGKSLYLFLSTRESSTTMRVYSPDDKSWVEYDEDFADATAHGLEHELGFIDEQFRQEKGCC